MNPDINEFTKFHRCLMKSAPEGYKPHYFKLVRHGKTPLPGRSWKKDAPLNFRYACKWMLQGGNIGIAGMEWDELVNIDLDGEHVDKSTLKPTLTTRSRSRTGIHGFYFSDEKDEIPNISTDDDGEVRSQNEYVVCAGSYVPVDDPSRIPEQWRDRAGYYTVEDARPPTKIVFDELPQIFKDQYNKAKAQEAERAKNRENLKPRERTGQCSAVFDVTAYDVVLREGGETEPSERWGSIFHDSKTEANMSLSRNGKYLHCWRHKVYHNGLSALTVLSGHKTCFDAGSPHKDTVGCSGVDDGAILHAWIYAKQNWYIPENDPVPVRALNYVALKHLGYQPPKDQPLPTAIYRQVLTIMEAEY